MTAVRIGLVLSGIVVILGTLYGVVGDFTTTETTEAGLFIVFAVYFGTPALAVIWLGVFVAIVIQKGIRVLGGNE